MILGIIASQGGKPAWLTTASTSYNGSGSVIAETMNATIITSQLTANYPPANYDEGYVMRVRVFNSALTLVGTTYRIRGTE